jgi:catechol 2,3-dioxygenase-like lactoylglutathione lyase family enzyme
MTMAWLDHVNIRTANLDAVSRFYGEILGLPKGPRPPFGFPGAWHYCGDKAVVHLIEVDKAPLGKDPKIEHFALRSTGLGDFVAHLRKKKVEHNAVRVPLTGMIQINVLDPDGNHIEVQFGAAEADGATDILDRTGDASPALPTRRKKVKQLA